MENQPAKKLQENNNHEVMKNKQPMALLLLGLPSLSISVIFESGGGRFGGVRCGGRLPPTRGDGLRRKKRFVTAMVVSSKSSSLPEFDSTH
ncbi:unnamed protein product [Linum trigynum]|uniref:Transmembrane protein n=1 Tax=Linum trigynum TaxID=586398 RepID=A0AAV2EWJ0_9ROSI